MGTGTTVAFLIVIGARFIVPLFIPRFPLPAILTALVLDGIDQTIFQKLGSTRPATRATTRRWTCTTCPSPTCRCCGTGPDRDALAVGRALFFYRLVGVVAFESTQWRAAAADLPEHVRVLLHRVRDRAVPVGSRAGSRRFWIITAAAIWIFVKLPQEYWIHIAQLDFTDSVARVPWLWAAVAVVLVVVALVAVHFLRPRLPAPDWACAWPPTRCRSRSTRPRNGTPG